MIIHAIETKPSLSANRKKTVGAGEIKLVQWIGELLI